MAGGNYEHPSYLTRQMLHLGRTLAGANTVSIQAAYPVDITVRKVTATVVTAGTVAGAAAGVIIKNGTTALATITLSTNIAGVSVSSSDLNSTVTAGNSLSVTNGTDATFVAYVTAEGHLPFNSTWS